jgi:hypothetical protein
MKGLLRILLVPILGLACAGPRAGSALHSVSFVEPPRVVRRGDEFLLCYRMAVSDRPPYPTLRFVHAWKNPDKAFYYFTVPTSSRREWGELVERPLADDGFTEHAQRNAVYWLDPDGKETQLAITTDGCGAH